MIASANRVGKKMELLMQMIRLIFIKDVIIKLLQNLPPRVEPFFRTIENQHLTQLKTKTLGQSLLRLHTNQQTNLNIM